MNRINIGIIGVGGYGKRHLESITHFEKEGFCSLKAAVIRDKDKYKQLVKRFSSNNLRMYPSFGEMFEKERASLDLIVIVSGIHEHDIHAIAALEIGYHVLCEKPAAGSKANGIRMRDAKRRSGKILAIGYQNIFSPSIQRIKAITLNGELGRLIRSKSIHLSPRKTEYYLRNKWAGKMEVHGKAVMDSPLHNAGAHYLQNMLYVAGPSAHECAEPHKIYGECYRAKPIACADTQFIRVQTKEGVEITAMASHAVSQDREIEVVYTYEKGRIVWKDGGETFVYLKDGKKDRLHEQFDNGKIPLELNVYQNVLGAISKQQAPLCTIENSLSQILCIEKLLESSSGVEEVEAEYCVKSDVIQGKQGFNAAIEGLDRLMENMYKEEKSFYESGRPWASKGRVIKV